MRRPYKYAAAIILMCVTGCAPRARYSHEVREALKELDKEIGAKEIYESRKEAHISKSTLVQKAVEGGGFAISFRESTPQDRKLKMLR